MKTVQMTLDENLVASVERVHVFRGQVYFVGIVHGNHK